MDKKKRKEKKKDNVLLKRRVQMTMKFHKCTNKRISKPVQNTQKYDNKPLTQNKNRLTGQKAN